MNGLSANIGLGERAPVACSASLPWLGCALAGLGQACPSLTLPAACTCQPAHTPYWLHLADSQHALRPASWPYAPLPTCLPPCRSPVGAGHIWAVGVSPAEYRNIILSAPVEKFSPAEE